MSKRTGTSLSDTAERATKEGATPGPLTSRAKLLLTAAAGAVGAAFGSLSGGARDARAANGDPITIGSATNAGTAGTTLTVTGNGGGFSGLQVDASGGTSYFSGAEGDGVFGLAGLGASGGFFAGTDVAISLDPLPSAGPPTPLVAFTGELNVDSNGVLWICIADGSPGTWLRLSSTNLLPTPQRLYDSRNTGGIFMTGETRTLDIAGVLSGIPSYATSVIGNLTIVNTVGQGFAVIYPKGSSQPATSTINWFGSGQIVANGFSIALGGSPGGIAVHTEASQSNATHIIVDISGYIV
jgi:hypothetical protein